MPELLQHVVPWLPYLIPPLVGAAIGYVTNYIAIRMLFRPLAERTFLGIRVPFTPGIIPRRRAELAESIGSMVSTQLLTEDAVRRHTGSPRFRTAIHDSIARFTTETLNAVPSEHSRDTVFTLVHGAEQTIGSLVEKMLRSDLFAEGAGTVVRNAVLSVTQKSPAEIIPGGEDAVRALPERVYDSLLSGKLREKLLVLVDEWFSRQVQANTPMSEFISHETVERAREILKGVYDPTFEHLITWLRKPDVRHEMARQGRVILSEILDKLSLLQRFFVSAAQYDRQLDERMPEIVDDLIRTLETAGRDPANRNRIVDAAVDAIEKIRRQGIADAAWRGRIDLPVRARQVVEEVLRILGVPTARERLLGAMEVVSSGLAQSTIAELAQDYLALDSEDLAQRIERTVVQLLSSESTVEAVCAAVRRIMTRFFDRLEHEPLGQVLNMKAERKLQIDDYLSDGVYRIVDRRLPDIVQTLDVRGLVVDKVNSLDVAQVEQLLLMVIARHLKYINLFGALLGGLIGASQIFVARLF